MFFFKVQFYKFFLLTTFLCLSQFSFAQQEVIEEIKTSVSKITKTSNKIQNLDLDDNSDFDNKKVG